MILALLVGAAVWIVPTLAGAHVMELQISGERFAELAEAAVDTFELCPERVTVTDYGFDGYLNRIVLRDSPHLRRSADRQIILVGPTFGVRNHRVELVLPLEVELKQLDTVEHGDPGDVDVRLQPDAVLSVIVVDGELVLNLLRLEPELYAPLEDEVRRRFGGFRIPISFAVLDEILLATEVDLDPTCWAREVPTRINGAGVTLDADGFLAIRLEFSERNCDCTLLDSVSGAGDDETLSALQQRLQAECREVDRVAWQDFFDGAVAPRRPGDEWSVFVDEEILRQAFEQTVRRNLAYAGDIALDGRLSSGWTPLGDGGAELPLYVSGTLDLPFCGVGVTLRPQVSVDLEAGELVVQIDASDYSISEHGARECGDAWTWVVSGFVPGVHDAFRTLVEILLHNYDLAAFGLPEIEVAGMTCEADALHMTCRSEVETPSWTSDGGLPLATLHLERLFGAADGALLGGTAEAAETEPHVLEGEVLPFEVGMDRCCTDLWYGASVRLDGYGGFCNRSPRLMDDPDGVYTIEPGLYGWYLDLDFDRYEASLSSPYPARVRVESYGGIATFELDPGDPGSDGTLEGARLGCGLARQLCGIGERHRDWDRDTEYWAPRDPEIDKYVSDPTGDPLSTGTNLGTLDDKAVTSTPVAVKDAVSSVRTDGVSSTGTTKDTGAEADAAVATSSKTAGVTSATETQAAPESELATSATTAAK